jgi:replication fork clamp-binding protein CrfC
MKQEQKQAEHHPLTEQIMSAYDSSSEWIKHKATDGLRAATGNLTRRCSARR